MRHTANTREKMKMTYRAPLLFALSTLTVAGCLQKLDSQASSGITAAVEPDAGLATGIPTNVVTPEIGITADESGEATEVTTDACEKVKHDIAAMRDAMCSGCHYQGASNPLRGITDDSMLINVAASAQFPGQKYVVPGSPDTSLLYIRAAIRQDMPPASTIDSPLPRPTISDMSNLRAWILCLGAPPAGGTGGTTGAGGSSGAAGASGAGGRMGAGGSSGVGGTTGMGGMNGAGGAMVTGLGGAPGADGGVTPACANVAGCNNPMTVTVPYTNNNIGQNALCLEVDETITSINCSNLGQRTVRVNGTTVGIANGTCNATVAIPAKRGAGYCVQVNGAQVAGQGATLSIM